MLEFRNYINITTACSLFCSCAVSMIGCSSKLPYNQYEFWDSKIKPSGSNVKLNGIYYSRIPKECYVDGKYDYIEYYVFYSNYYYLNIVAYDSTENQSVTNNFLNYLSNTIMYDYRKQINYWGNYTLKDDSVLMQEFYSEKSFTALQKKKGKLTNNDVLEFKSSICKLDPSYGAKFHFEKTNLKPDSLNPFISNKTLMRNLEIEKQKRKIQE